MTLTFRYESELHNLYGTIVCEAVRDRLETVTDSERQTIGVLELSECGWGRNTSDFSLIDFFWLLVSELLAVDHEDCIRSLSTDQQTDTRF